MYLHWYYPRARIACALSTIPQSSHQSGSHLDCHHSSHLYQGTPAHAFRRQLANNYLPMVSGPYIPIDPSCNRDEKPGGGGSWSKHVCLVWRKRNGGVREAFGSDGLPGWLIGCSRGLAVDLVKDVVAFIQHYKPGTKWRRRKIKFETSRGENMFTRSGSHDYLAIIDIGWPKGE